MSNKKALFSSLVFKIACLVISMCVMREHTLTAQQTTVVKTKRADAQSTKKAGLPWDTIELFKTPKTYISRDCAVKGFKAFFYEGLIYKAKKTRVFAYYKAPAGRPPAGGWPAVVCIHGGGGTAFPEWVQAWVNHGYAAIAMDLEGHLPKGEFPNREWYEYAGPSRITTFGDIEISDREQWFYHAVADVVKAVSLLSAYPEINRNKIGIHGISWGGVIASAVTGIDHRIAFAIPVYGCGFLYETSCLSFKKYFDVMTAEQLANYKSKWDPSIYLGKNNIPTLFYIGVTDQAFPLDIWQKSALLTKGERMLCIPVNSEHGHIWDQKEIFAFADAVEKKSWPLFKIEAPTIIDGIAAAGISVYEKSGGAPAPAVSASQIVYTKDTCNFQARSWESKPAQLRNNAATAALPPLTRAFYFNVTTAQGLTYSSPFKEVD